MEIRILDGSKIPFDRRYSLKEDTFEDIKEEFVIEESLISISCPVSHNGIVWSPSQICFGKYAICDKVEYPEEIDTDYVDSPVCPYCAKEVLDPWELADSGSIICSECQGEFSYERIITVDYCTSKVKEYTPEKI